MLRVNVWEARSAGTFNFRTNETQGPNPNTASSTAGFGFASFLLGTGQPNDVLIQNWKNVAANSFYWAVYAQDDWRVNSRLTLNLGAALRHRRAAHRALQPDELLRSGRALAARGQVPAFPDLRGGVVFVGVDGRSRYQYNWDTNNIAPRLGAVVSAERQDRGARAATATSSARRIRARRARSGRSASAPRTSG